MTQRGEGFGIAWPMDERMLSNGLGLPLMLWLPGNAPPSTTGTWASSVGPWWSWSRPPGAAG